MVVSKMALFVLLALLFILAQSRPFDPILLITKTEGGMSTPALYWEYILPNTPMPKAIKDRVDTDFMDQKYTCESVYVKAPLINSEPKDEKQEAFYSSKDEPIPLFYHPYRPKDEYLQILYRSKDEPNQLFYPTYDSMDELHNNPISTIFFFETDLHLTKSMQAYFPKTCNAVTFLPREVANSIPFSSDKLSEIYNEFSVKPGSTIQAMMKDTINICEMPTPPDEKKKCATSLESMIDFTTSILGNNVEAISSELDTQTEFQKYAITEIKMMKGDNSVICHKLNYVYAVFYCHVLPSTKVYRVSMVGDDGTTAKTTAICHHDTSAWNPYYLAFQVLKVKPGTVPVCHFLPLGHIMWTNR